MTDNNEEPANLFKDKNKYIEELDELVEKFKKQQDKKTSRIMHIDEKRRK